MSQADLAEKSGLSEYIVCRIERCTADPRESQTEAIARALGFEGRAQLELGDARDGAA